MKLVGQSIIWGAVFGLLVSVVITMCLVIYWGGKSGGAGAPAGLYFLFVPIVSVEGALAAGVLFGAAGIVITLSRGRLKPTPIAYATLGLLLSLFIVLPFAAWVAGGYLKAIRGAQGTYSLVPTMLFPILVIGCMVGAKLNSSAKTK